MTIHSTGGSLISIISDSSHACHINGRSHEAYGLKVGNSTAPTIASSNMQLALISLNHMQDELLAIGKGARLAITGVALSKFLGFDQKFPIIFRTDNDSAITLTQSPAINKNSRHIRKHIEFLRDKVAQGQLKGLHIDNKFNHINVMTKPLQGSQFIFERDNLMNVASRI